MTPEEQKEWRETGEATWELIWNRDRDFLSALWNSLGTPVFCLGTDSHWRQITGCCFIVKTDIGYIGVYAADWESSAAQGWRAAVAKQRSETCSPT